MILFNSTELRCINKDMRCSYIPTFSSFFLGWLHFCLGHFWVLLWVLYKANALGNNIRFFNHVLAIFSSFTNIVSLSVGFFTWHFWRVGIFMIFMATQFSHFNLLKKRDIGRNCWYGTMALLSNVFEVCLRDHLDTSNIYFPKGKVISALVVEFSRSTGNLKKKKWLLVNNLRCRGKIKG